MGQPVLSDELATFLASGVSITVGSRNGELEASAATAWAASVDDDREHVTLFLPEKAAPALLQDLRQHPEIAALFDRPTEHRACQLKGGFVSSRRARPAERAEVERQLEAFKLDLAAIGIPPDMSAGWKLWPCVAIRMRVGDCYEQTPGPGTGERILPLGATPAPAAQTSERLGAGPSRPKSAPPPRVAPAAATDATARDSRPQTVASSMIPLESLSACFQGLIPSWFATCSKEGVPNVAILSHVDYVDSRHVALSFQFFNKSKRNVMENPKATVRIYDPDTFQVYALRLRFVRTETEGALYESMRLRIEAIASYSGLKGIFRLLGADVYEVLSVEPVEHEVGRPAAQAKKTSLASESARVPFTMKALQAFSEQLQQDVCLDGLLDSVLRTLDEIFGFHHAMILLASETPERLELIASRGYPEGGVGSEVGFGEGIIGMVAEARKPIRITGLLRHMLYANAVAERAQRKGLCPEDRRIPLPGLAEPDSQLGIPLLVRDELIGVLCIESDRSYRFHEEDRAYLEVLGGYLAIAIQNALLRERAEEDEEPSPRPRLVAPLTPVAPAKPPCRSRIEVAYYKNDECVLVDGEYLVRSLPAKILRKILDEHRSEGRVEFTNRQLRLDKSLNLPDFKDNLESRLILLRRRLAERCPSIQIVQSGRGRFRLQLAGELSLVERP